MEWDSFLHEFQFWVNWEEKQSELWKKSLYIKIGAQDTQIVR